MLDQNTDRMWFVIGAVIVGAAIIFIANGTLPTLFASVSDTFEEATTKGTEVISDISVRNPNLLGEGLTNDWKTYTVPKTAAQYTETIALDTMGLQAGDVITISADYEFGDNLSIIRTMFNDQFKESNDEREINIMMPKRSGSGRFEQTVTVPEGSKTIALRIQNGGGKDTYSIRLRRVKIERGPEDTGY